MSFKKVEVMRRKLEKVGDTVTGYLLSKEPWSFANDEGETVKLTGLVLRTAGGEVVKMNVGADYNTVLVVGAATKLSRIKKVVDGKEKAVTEVQQDTDDAVSVS